MNCPHCGSAAHKDGFTPSHAQAYRCKCCKRRFSSNKAGKPKGKAKPLSDAERSRRYRVRKKNQDNA